MVSSALPPPPTCPDGFDEHRIAALVDDPTDEAAWSHARTCPVCARWYLSHCAIGASVRRIAAATAAATAPARATPPRRATLLSFPRVPMAAAILVGAMGLAAAGAAWFLRPVIVSTGGATLGRASEFELRSGLDLSAAAIPAEAVVEGWTQFVDRGRGAGTVVATTTAGRLELAAFDAEGRLLWTATGSDWPEVRDGDALAFVGMGTFVARRAPGISEERLWIAVTRYGTGAVYFADPGTGRCTGRYVHRGPLASEMEYGRPVVSVLPAAEGARRRVLITGHHSGMRQPDLCLAVLETDAPPGTTDLTPLQHLTLPSLRISGLRGPTDVGVRMDWTEGHEAVTLLTQEGLVIHLPWTDGKLAPEAGWVAFADHAPDAFRNATGRAWDDHVKEQGGPEAYAEALRATIVESTVPPRRSLRGR